MLLLPFFVPPSPAASLILLLISLRAYTEEVRFLHQNIEQEKRKACLHGRVLGEIGVDLAQLDSEAADLDLVIGAAETLGDAVWQIPAEISGAVEAIPGEAGEGVDDELGLALILRGGGRWNERTVFRALLLIAT